MGKMIQTSVAKLAGTQFLGNEFKVQAAHRNGFLKLKELNLQMGTESKTFRIEKRTTGGAVIVLVQQSVDGTGAPAPTTAESVVITGGEFEVLLAPGEQVQIVTSGATSAMSAKLYLEEVIFE